MKKGICIIALAAFFSTPALASEMIESPISETVSIDLPQPETKQAPLYFETRLSSQSVKTVIEKQLRAIRDRDDRAAYNLASDKNLEEFSTPQDYMRHLRREKPSLYNHVHFEVLPASKNNKFRKVKLLDRRGKEALAMFKVEKDNAGTWRIENVLVLKTEEDPI